MRKKPDMWMARQGDVLIIRTDGKVPEGYKKVPSDKGRTVLAYGEVTGHAHAIDDAVSALFERSGVEDRFLEIKKPTSLKHEEHDPVKLEPGTYIVRRQRQMNLEDAKHPQRVAD